MTDQIKGKKAGPERGKQARRRSHSLDRCTWQAADADRFLFKGQCYDAGPGAESKCGICGGPIRLCYVLKVLESPDLLSPEIGKLTVGECCFQSINAANGKLYRQLLAAAINLRTFIEAIQRDTAVFRTGAPDKINRQPSPSGAPEEPLHKLFEDVIGEGGDHA